MTNEAVTSTETAAVAEQGATQKKGASKAKKGAKEAAPKKQAKGAPKQPKEKATGKKASKPKTEAAASREGSKKAAVLELLRRKEGATMAEIAKATGWQNHSIRGFISGQLTKKMGLAVESTKNEAGGRSYRIAK
jgi:hypothetical protein